MLATQAEKNSGAKKTVLIVDDHPVLRLGLTALIESEPDLAVCGQVDTCVAALEAIRQSTPDLVMVDLMLKGCDGLGVVKGIKAYNPEIPALVLSMHDEAVYAERAIRAGARGYVNKKQLDNTVLLAIRCVLAGETYLSDKLTARLAAKLIHGKALATDSPLETLSDRELQVFRLIGQGRSTRQIAETLHLSIKTIESHRAHIKNKLSIETTAELAQRASQWI